MADKCRATGYEPERWAVIRDDGTVICITDIVQADIACVYLNAHRGWTRRKSFYEVVQAKGSAE